jgi:hypothetical protein
MNEWQCISIDANGNPQIEIPTQELRFVEWEEHTGPNRLVLQQRWEIHPATAKSYKEWRTVPIVPADKATD